MTVYTLQEVANTLKCTRQTIYNYVTAGKLNAVKIGKEYRVTEKDLEDLLQMDAGRTQAKRGRKPQKAKAN